MWLGIRVWVLVLALPGCGPGARLLPRFPYLTSEECGPGAPGQPVRSRLGPAGTFPDPRCQPQGSIVSSARLSLGLVFHLKLHVCSSRAPPAPAHAWVTYTCAHTRTHAARGPHVTWPLSGSLPRRGALPVNREPNSEIRLRGAGPAAGAVRGPRAATETGQPLPLGASVLPVGQESPPAETEPDGRAGGGGVLAQQPTWSEAGNGSGRCRGEGTWEGGKGEVAVEGQRAWRREQGLEGSAGAPGHPPTPSEGLRSGLGSLPLHLTGSVRPLPMRKASNPWGQHRRSPAHRPPSQMLAKAEFCLNAQRGDLGDESLKQINRAAGGF